MANQASKKRGFNAVDVIIVAAVIIVAVFAVLKFTGNTPAASTPPTRLEYTCLVTRVNEQTVESLAAFMPNDRLMASGVLLDAYVTSYEVSPSQYWIENPNGGMHYVTDPTRYDIVFTVQGQVRNSITSELGTQEVRLGKTHILKTAHFEFSTGTIIGIKWGDEVVFAEGVPLT